MKKSQKLIDNIVKLIRIAEIHFRILAEAIYEGGLKSIKDGQVKKGNVLIMAQTAGIMAAKKTAEIIPLCHPLKIDSIDVNCQLDEKKSVINIEAKVKAEEKTGVEMEALTAVVAAALTIYDMCKSIERGITITDICLQRKSG